MDALPRLCKPGDNEINDLSTPIPLTCCAQTCTTEECEIPVRTSHRSDIGALSTKANAVICRANLIQILIKPSVCKAAMEGAHFVPSTL